ncbi:hypothetical protein D320_02632 [Haloferax sp. BAB-2207]|nr:hypothetical protein D320_02632 [Haloferax sp. BAB-2207]
MVEERGLVDGGDAGFDADFRQLVLDDDGLVFEPRALVAMMSISKPSGLPASSSSFFAFSGSYICISLSFGEVQSLSGYHGPFWTAPCP